MKDRTKFNLDKLLAGTKYRHFIYDKKRRKVSDNVVELLNRTVSDDFYYVCTASLLKDFYEKNPNTEWNIKSIFQLGNAFNFANYSNNPNFEKLIGLLRKEFWFFVVLTKKDVQNITIGFHNTKKLYSRKRQQATISFLWKPDKNAQQKFFLWPLETMGTFFNNYYSTINEIIRQDKLPIFYQDYKRENNDFEFNIIPKKNFFLRYLQNLSRYKKTVIEDFDFPESDEKLVICSDCLRHGYKKSGDLTEPVLTNTQHLICTEDFYKHFELVSKSTGWIIEYYNVIVGSKYFFWKLFKSDYIEDFFTEYYKYHKLMTSREAICFYDIGDLNILNEITIFLPSKINESFLKKQYELSSEESYMLRNKLNSNTDNFYSTESREIILRDLNELRTSFSARTYKAAIILAGSILEAFLIDWLSELHGKDYFSEDYMIFDKYRGKERRADLKDYIDAIEELKKPNWYEAASKATEIRKKRNLVHAKLYIDNKDISKETCTEIINYLEYVINTRWNNCK